MSPSYEQGEPPELGCTDSPKHSTIPSSPSAREFARVGHLLTVKLQRVWPELAPILAAHALRPEAALILKRAATATDVSQLVCDTGLPEDVVLQIARELIVRGLLGTVDTGQ